MTISSTDMTPPRQAGFVAVRGLGACPSQAAEKSSIAGVLFIGVRLVGRIDYRILAVSLIATV